MPSGNPNPLCPAAFTCGWGRHSYALAVCTHGTVPSLTGGCPSAGSISAWNNFDAYLNFPSANKDVYVPLAYITSAFAGRIVVFSLFNPGPSHGHGDNDYQMIVPPDPCLTVNYPSVSGTWVRQTPFPGAIFPVVTGACAQSTNSIYASARNGGGQQTSDDLYQGLWVQATVQLPTNFKGGEFWLDVHSSQGKNYNEMGLMMGVLGGSPVHIIG
jgi:hypothetical protein